MMTFAVFGAGFLMRPLGAMALVRMAGQVKFFSNRYGYHIDWKERYSRQREQRYL